MTWVKLDDAFFRNPKARAAGAKGRALYLAGLCHSAAELLDGRIPKTSLPLVAAEAEVPARATAKRLVEVGLWSDESDHYWVPDYLDYNPSAEKVRSERAAAKERMNRRRSSPDVRANTDSTSSEVRQPPSPSPSPTGSSQLSSHVSGAPGDDDENLFQATLDRYVDVKVERANGHAKGNPARYRAAAMENARLEVGGDLRQLIAEFDAPVDVLVGKLLGEPNSLGNYRRIAV